MQGCRGTRSGYSRIMTVGFVWKQCGAFSRSVNGRKMVLHTTSSFFATIPLKNNHMGGFHDHDRQNT